MTRKILGLLVVIMGLACTGCANPTASTSPVANTTPSTSPTASNPPSGEKAITAFAVTNPAATGVIKESTHAIAITVPFGTAVTALVPTITITGASVSPAAGTAQNFTNPVTYTVAAADGSMQAYTVTVTVMTTRLVGGSIQGHVLSLSTGYHGDRTP